MADRTQYNSQQPQTQQTQYPNLNPYTSQSGSGSGTYAQDMRSSLGYNVQSTADSLNNSSSVPSLQNGPVADAARQETLQTKNELSNLASSRTTPTTKTATGQNLTHYHSFFYSLLSWENPRATAISYAAITTLIFVTRYVPIVRYGLRLTWITLGITAAAEIAGKAVLGGEGFTSKVRPRAYYTIPRETLDSVTEDATELVNFFVIEFQRIVFAENIYATVAAFFGALLTYLLMRIMPGWGLALLLTSVLFLAPLIYIRNQGLIDHHLANAGNLISEQTHQVRVLASHHTSKAVEASGAALKDYSAKAQDLIGQGKKAAVDKGLVSTSTANQVVGNPELHVAPVSDVKIEQHPLAIKADAALATHPSATKADAAGATYPVAPKVDPAFATYPVPVAYSDPIAQPAV